MLPLTTDRGEGFVHGADDWPIFVRWVRPDAPKGRVLVLHGYSEHSGRYAHVLNALAERGYAAIASDHRGHGRTARVHGDLESTTAVVSDLAVVHRVLVEGASGVPTVVLAHSMGGLFALRYLALYGESVAGAIVNSPAMRIPDSISPAVRLLARGIARVAPATPMQTFFNPQYNMRDSAAQQAMWDDPLVYKGRVRARTGAEILRLLPLTWEGLHRVRCPVLLTHGALDTRVPVSVSEQILDALGAADKGLHVFEGLLHETHNEPEQQAVLSTWLDWFDSRIECEPR